MSANKTQTSFSLPPNSNEVSFSSNSSTILSETYFLKVDLTLFIPDKSSNDKTTPEFFSFSSKTGEIVRLIWCFLSLLSFMSKLLSKSISLLSSVFSIKLISLSFFSKTI